MKMGTKLTTFALYTPVSNGFEDCMKPIFSDNAKENLEEARNRQDWSREVVFTNRHA